MKLPLWTFSGARAARGCKRLYKLRYDEGYRPVADEEEAPRFGSLFHDGQDPWWRLWEASPDERLDAALQAIRKNAADEFDLAKAEALMLGYHHRWIEDSAHYEVLGVELTFEGPLVNPITGAASRTWRRAGKIDVLVRDRRSGLVYLVEHKTSGEDITPGSPYWKRLKLDGQISTYYEGARLLGHEVAGCVYDVIKKPGIRPSQVALLDVEGVEIVLDAAGDRVRTKDGKRFRRTGDSALGYVLQTRPETPQEYQARLIESIASDPGAYFARGEVVRLEAEMREAMADDWSLAREVRDGQLAGVAPRNPDYCVRYGYTCPFFGVCTGEDSLEDPSKFTRVADVHPELAGAVCDASSKEETAA